MRINIINSLAEKGRSTGIGMCHVRGHVAESPDDQIPQVKLVKVHWRGLSPAVSCNNMFSAGYLSQGNVTADTDNFDRGPKRSRSNFVAFTDRKRRS